MVYVQLKKIISFTPNINIVHIERALSVKKNSLQKVIKTVYSGKWKVQNTNFHFVTFSPEENGLEYCVCVCVFYNQKSKSDLFVWANSIRVCVFNFKMLWSKFVYTIEQFNR